MSYLSHENFSAKIFVRIASSLLKGGEYDAHDVFGNRCSERYGGNHSAFRLQAAERSEQTQTAPWLSLILKTNNFEKNLTPEL